MKDFSKLPKEENGLMDTKHFLSRNWTIEQERRSLSWDAMTKYEEERAYELNDDRVPKKYLDALAGLKKNLKSGVDRLKDSKLPRVTNDQIKDRLTKDTKAFIKTLEEAKNCYTSFSPEARLFIKHKHIAVGEVFDESENAVSRRRLFKKFVRRKNLYVKRKFRQLEDLFTNGRWTSAQWDQHRKSIDNLTDEEIAKRYHKNRERTDGYPND